MDPLTCKPCEDAAERAQLACDVLDHMYPQPAQRPQDHVRPLHPLPPGGVDPLVQCHREHAADMYAEAALMLQACGCGRGAAQVAGLLERVQMLDPAALGRTGWTPIDNPSQTTYNKKGDGTCTAPSPTAHERSTS